MAVPFPVVSTLAGPVRVLSIGDQLMLNNNVKIIITIKLMLK